MVAVKLCDFPDCGRKHASKGLCNTHYWMQKRGRPLTVIKPRDGSQVLTERELFVRSRYGITQERYDQMLERQGGVCCICGGVNPSGRRLHIDHDHSCCPGTKPGCGQCVRGLLCSRCNTGLGQFLDSPELMVKAIVYLTGGDH